ncbi:MAG: hypothetical protein AB3N19_12140 [Ruegeria sp.]
MHRGRQFALTFSAALALASAGNAEEALIGCGTTDLLHSNTSIKFVGANPLEAEVGDRRILHWYLEDLTGLYVGSFDVVTTVMGGTSDMGHYVRVDGSFTLPNGNIFVATTTTLNDATDTMSSGNAQEVIDWAVIGGTGDFSEASGVVSIVVPEKGVNHLENRPITLSITC